MNAEVHARPLFAWTLFVWCVVSGAAAAQDAPSRFAGGVGGISALSADARAAIDRETAGFSGYAPENGPALNLFVGAHVREYVAVQANYVWNRNALSLASVQVADGRASFYEQQRRSSQHALVGDVLVYFRERRSRIGPYLSAGAGLVRFDSEVTRNTVVRADVPPAPRFEATRATLRVAVGMDVRAGAWRIRYSFSESLSGNPISAQLAPPAPRNLANFQNLVGILREF